MAGPFFWLSDAAWAAIEPHLPDDQPKARRVVTVGDLGHSARV